MCLHLTDSIATGNTDRTLAPQIQAELGTIVNISTSLVTAIPCVLRHIELTRNAKVDIFAKLTGVRRMAGTHKQEYTTRLG